MFSFFIWPAFKKIRLYIFVEVQAHSCYHIFCSLHFRRNCTSSFCVKVRGNTRQLNVFFQQVISPALQQLKKIVDCQQFIGGDCLQMIRTSENVFFIIHIRSKILRLKNDLYYIGIKRSSRPKDSQEFVEILVLYLQINMSVLRTH